MSDWWERAQEVRDTFDRDLSRIRGDAGLSPEGKRRRIAVAWFRAQRTATQLRGDASEQQEAHRRRSERRLLGIQGTNPADVISFRDAHDRVESIKTAAEGKALLTRALRQGDRTLAQAVVQRALDRVALEPAWREVAQAWADENPSKADDLAACVAERTMSRNHRLRTALFDDAYGNVPKPQELAHLSQQAVESLAAEQ
jgi:hypothetical protein